MKLNVTKYEVGKRVPEWSGVPDSVYFQITGSGCEVVAFYRNPNEKEIASHKAGQPFEIRFTPLDGVIMVSFKAGGEPWQDAPFSSHLAPSMTLPDEIPDGHGLSLTLILVDGANGEIKALRQIGLGTTFSRELIKAIVRDSERDFDKSAYDRKIASIYAKYTSRQIADMAPYPCRYKVR